MKRIIAYIVMLCSLFCFASCGKSNTDSSSGDGNEKNYLNIDNTAWNAVDNYNIEKVTTIPTFQLLKGVEESINGIVPFDFFSDGMVLQRNAVNKVYGTASYDGGVAVEICGNVYYGTASNGKFEVYLPPIEKGEDLTMTIYGALNKVTVKNVCFGEVLLFSGQSNMEWRMIDTLSTYGPPKPGKQYLPFYGTYAAAYTPTPEADPDTYSEYAFNSELSKQYEDKARSEIETDKYIRMLHVNNDYTQYDIGKNKQPREDYSIRKSWKTAESKDAIYLTSMFAYYFAKNVRKMTGVPVGIICAGVGGTPTTTWVPRNIYEANKEYFPVTNEDTADWNSTSSCYNTLISPMLGYKFGSYVWYQGEGECSTTVYTKAFSLLVDAYRTNFDNPNMKVLVVSLPRYGGGAVFPEGYSQESYGSADKELAMLNAFSALGRANQQLLPSVIENCAVTVSHNTGDFDDIHPSDKTVIAYQAACSYFKDLYGFKEESLLYPTLNKVYRIEGGVKLTFNNLCGELVFKNGGRGFQVSEDGVSYKQVVAEKVGDSICLYATNAGVDTINYVRYGWIEYPRITRVDVEKYVSIFNSYGMPLDQFEASVAN